MLQRQHVQRIGKDEPAGDPAAENVARPVSRVGVSRTDGAKQRLGLGAVLAGPLGPQFVMKLLVHGSSQPPDVRLPGQGGARTTHDLGSLCEAGRTLSADWRRPRAPVRVCHTRDTSGGNRLPDPAAGEQPWGAGCPPGLLYPLVE